MTCENCARMEAQAAAMRSFLEKIVQEWTEPTQTCANATVDMRYFLKQVEKALSSDAGKELLAKVARMDTALRGIISVVDSSDWSRALALIRGRANEALRE